MALGGNLGPGSNELSGSLEEVSRGDISPTPAKERGANRYTVRPFPNPYLRCNSFLTLKTSKSVDRSPAPLILVGAAGYRRKGRGPKL